MCFLPADPSRVHALRRANPPRIHETARGLFRAGAALVVLVADAGHVCTRAIGLLPDGAGVVTRALESPGVSHCKPVAPDVLHRAGRRPAEAWAACQR